MSLMDSNAIQIAVRCRPWHETKEVPFLAVPTDQPYFYGDGNIGGSARPPVAAGALRNVVEIIDDRELDFDKPQETNEGRRGAFMSGRRFKNRKYVFDQVFSMEATQEQVFAKTAQPLLPGVLDGYNATVFAYGATGCGKTHTISGTEEQPGIIIQTMRELFQLVEETKLQYDTYFQMSMVEIYNETIRDLLSDEYPACPPGGLKLLENEKERVKVAHVTEKTPESADEVMALVMLGNNRRSTSFTARNSTSSRSHLVLQINVVRNERKTDVELSETVVKQRSTSATLSIIDLAGSEKASVNRGQRMKEGANINKSLLALSGCISALCQPPVRGIRQHVPYRDSKLTRLLKFSLGGNCRTVMINCISPSSKDIEETNNTLLWADKAKKVSTKVSRNTAGVELRTAQWIQKIVTLEATIKSMEAQMASGHNANSATKQRRLNAIRADSQGEMKRIQQELDELLPVIVDGSEMDALWNASVLQVEALETRLADIDIEIQSGRSLEEAQQEKTHIRSLIQQQDQAYRFNSDIQAGMQRKSNKNLTLGNLLKKAEERRFDDDLAEAGLEHQLEIVKHQGHISRSIAAAKERGLRDYIAQQADSATKSASLLSRFSIILRKEINSLAGDPTADAASVLKRLQSLVSVVDTSVGSLFGEEPKPLSVAQARLPPSIAAPSPRRTSIRAGGLSPKRVPHRVSPKKTNTIRRSLFPASSIPVASPSLSSPVSAPAAISMSESAPAAKKVLRFPDETGEGKIDDWSIAPDCPVFSSPSNVGSDSVANITTDSSSSEWEDVQNAQAKAPIPAVPAALRPLSSAPSVGNAVSNATAGASAAQSEVPAWKQNRMMRGLVNPIESIAEESSPSGKSSPLGASRLPTTGLMGPPSRVTRPGPLGELHTVPAVGSGPRASMSTFPSTSSLMKPTAASAARASLAGNSSSLFANVKIPMSSLTSANSSNPSGSMGPPSSTSRRASTIGPARYDRPKHRASLLPGAHPHRDPQHSMTMGETSFASFSFGTSGLPSTGSANTSALSGGARRVEGAKPRMSMQPGGSLPRGPGLSSRPSMSKLNTSISAGDTSKRAWR